MNIKLMSDNFDVHSPELKYDNNNINTYVALYISTTGK